MLSIFFINF